MCQVSTCVGFHVSGKHTCQGGSTHERKHEAQRKHSRRLNVSTQQCYAVTTLKVRFTL